MEWDFRGLSAALLVNHNPVRQWGKRVREQLPNAPEDNDIPEVAQLDERQSAVLLAVTSQEQAQANAFVKAKNTVRWLWTAVSGHQPGILAWVLGPRSAATFLQLCLC